MSSYFEQSLVPYVFDETQIGFIKQNTQQKGKRRNIDRGLKSKLKE
jgi:hypothetical protein